MKPAELGAAALRAILDGTDITLTLPAGEKWPRGWPRGELLSVTATGKNVSFDPLKVLALMQRLGKLDNGKAPNVELRGGRLYRAASPGMTGSASCQSRLLKGLT